jgi:protein-disulfide isomerase
LPTGLTEDGHHWIGSRAPVLTIDEYVDYACPHCGVASQATLRALAKHASKVRLVRRNNPRMKCSATIPTSCMPLRAAICAGQQDRFWQMDRWLFANFDKGQVNLEAAAREVNLDLPTLRACYQAPATFESANASYVDASKGHILSTPSYRIQGKEVNIKDVFERISATH